MPPSTRTAWPTVYGSIAVALQDRKGARLGALSSTVQRHACPGQAMVTKLLPGLQDAALALRAVV